MSWKPALAGAILVAITGVLVGIAVGGDGGGGGGGDEAPGADAEARTEPARETETRDADTDREAEDTDTDTETAPAPEPETDTESGEEAERVRLGVRAGNICGRARAASGRTRARLGFQPGQTKFESFEQVVTLTRAENVLRRDRLRQLKSLTAPESLRVPFERYLAGAERDLVLAEGLLSAATDGDPDRVNELIRQIKLRGRRNHKLAAAASLGRCAR